MLNGVRFPEDLYKKVTSGDMPFEEILAIVDIDQRTQAMRFGDPVRFVQHSGGKMLDTVTKKLPDGKQIWYRLYEIPKGPIFTQDAYYVIYDDPSTGKQYMSGVEPCRTVAEAMGWKFGITAKQWENLVPLVTEA